MRSLRRLFRRTRYVYVVSRRQVPYIIEPRVYRTFDDAAMGAFEWVHECESDPGFHLVCAQSQYNRNVWFVARVGISGTRTDTGVRVARIEVK